MGRSFAKKHSNKIRQRRKLRAKLYALRHEYTHAKSSSEKDAIKEKLAKYLPTVDLDRYLS